MTQPAPDQIKQANEGYWFVIELVKELQAEIKTLKANKMTPTQEEIKSKAQDIYITTTNKDEKADHYKFCLFLAEVILRVEALQAWHNTGEETETDDELFEIFKAWVQEQYGDYSEFDIFKAGRASIKK